MSLEQMIQNRETEMQRYYDANIERLKYVESQIEILTSLIDDYKTEQRKINKNINDTEEEAARQGVLHIL